MPRSLSSAQFASVTGFAAFVAAVAAVTAAHGSGLIGIGAVAASPKEVASGKLWLLITSGLLVQKPLVLSVLSFAVFGAVTLAVCGFRVLLWSAFLGHVASTLVVYGFLAAGWAASPELFRNTWSAPDYGVSAITAAWLGAIAAVSWRRAAGTPGSQFLIVVSCLAVASVGWAVRGHLNVLDSEHVVAFALGVSVPWRLNRVDAVLRSRSLGQT